MPTVKPSSSPSPKPVATPSPKASGAAALGAPTCTLRPLAKMQGALGTSSQPAQMAFFSYAYPPLDRGSAPVTVNVPGDAKTVAIYAAWLHANQAFALIKLACPTGSIAIENAVVTAVHSSGPASPASVTFSDQTLVEN